MRQQSGQVVYGSVQGQQPSIRELPLGDLQGAGEMVRRDFYPLIYRRERGCYARIAPVARKSSPSPHATRYILLPRTRIPRWLAVTILLETAAFPVQAQVPPPRPSRLAAAADQQQAKPAQPEAQPNKQRVRWSNVARTGAKAPRRLTVREREALFKQLSLEWETGRVSRSAVPTSLP